MKEKMKLNWLWISIVATLILSVTLVLKADDDEEGEEHKERGGSWARSDSGKEVLQKSDFTSLPNHAQWKTECSACHMLYHPGLLPTRSWNKLMGNLDKHFGENAGLDQKVGKSIEDFLIQHSADNNGGRRASKILDTIPKNETPISFTETRYFKRKHHEISQNVYKREKIKSAANCIACHSGAERGIFDEHEVVIPKDTLTSPKK